MKYMSDVFKIALVLLMLSTVSCKKDWLEVIDSKSKFILKNIDEFQAVLDNNSYMNDGTPYWPDLSDDDYFVPEASWLNSTNMPSRNAYVWAKDIYGGESFESINANWTDPYRVIFNSNIVLQGVENIERNYKNQQAWDNLKGSAFFFRSLGFYWLTQNFAPVYNQTTASSDLGVPIRLEPSIEDKSIRATVKRNYDQIISDLLNAYPLLPAQAIAKTRPSKPAAFALLARTYLLMDDYTKAHQYADSSLKYQNSLINYNTIKTATYPMLRFNEEVVLHTTQASHTFTTYPLKQVDRDLYASYNNNDLRKSLWFVPQADGGIRYNGSYNQALQFFSGITTGEMYLVRAETAARLGNTQAAMNDLNTLLSSRFKTGTFAPFIAADSESALRTILQERRKELAFRSLRWSDLRRLNKDPRFAKILTRTIGGITYTLPPNDPRYTFPIPLIIIELSDIQQNER